MKQLYYCNPIINTECKKTHCQYLTNRGECNATTKKEFAQREKDGKPKKVIYENLFRAI